MAVTTMELLGPCPPTPPGLHSSRRAETRLQNVSCEDQHLDGVPAALAQMVEHLFEEQGVPGSLPGGGTYGVASQLAMALL